MTIREELRIFARVCRVAHWIDLANLLLKTDAYVGELEARLEVAREAYEKAKSVGAVDPHAQLSGTPTPRDVQSSKNSTGEGAT